MIEIFKALSDENRIRILNLLKKEELCVCEIELILNITQSNASRHLNKLKSNGIITSFKEAQWVHYTISQNFRMKNRLLFEYIEKELRRNEQCIQDDHMLQRYIESSYNCQHIRENKDMVLEYLIKERNK